MRPGRGVVPALLLVVVVVNLPFLHHTWQQRRIDRDGLEVTAEVTATVLREDTDPRYVVRFRLPNDIDPDQQTWPAQVDRETWEAAEESGEVAVRVLPDQPSAHRVGGEESSALGWIMTGVADLMIIAVALVLWRRRRSGADSA